MLNEAPHSMMFPLCENRGGSFTARRSKMPSDFRRIGNALRTSLFTRAVALAAIGPSDSSAQTVLRGEGQPMRTPLGYGISLNEDSSLVRQWTIVTEETFPIQISKENFAGVAVELEEDSRDDFVYTNVLILNFGRWLRLLKSTS